MFKKNCHLLITGGTGSFGKAMLEKYYSTKIFQKFQYLVEMKKNKMI